MENNELRIGNWINVDSYGEQQVVDVMCDGINTPNLEGVHYGLISGIPLTEEWLLKFGLQNESYLPVYEIERNSLFAIKKWEERNQIIFYVFWGDNKLSNIEVKYAHQLQNLYFALTGKELENGK